MENPQNTSADDAKKLLAKQKREARRVERMLSGLLDLENWMTDILRQGMASLENQPYSFWTSLSARMVDSQLRGAEKVIRQMALLPGSSPNWPAKMLEKFAELFLLVTAFRRLENLPEPIARDVKTKAGISIKKETVKTEPSVNDNWLVLGVVESIEDDLRARRTWLFGDRSEKTALILDYAHGSRDFSEFYEFGSRLAGEIAFYPGNFPLRGIFTSPAEVTNGGTLPEGACSFNNLLEDYTLALSKSPFIQRYPFMMSQVRPDYQHDTLRLIDQDERIIPCIDRDLTAWKLVAFSGNKPVSLFGEWDGRVFRPVSAWKEGRLVLLNGS